MNLRRQGQLWLALAVSLLAGHCAFAATLAEPVRLRSTQASLIGVNDLQRAETSNFSHAHGQVAMILGPKGALFRVRAFRLDTAVLFETFLETAPGSDQYDDLGSLDWYVRSHGGYDFYTWWQFQLATNVVDGVNVADLAGRRLEIRERQGPLTLYTILPAMADPRTLSLLKASANLTAIDTNTSQATLRTRFDPRRGRSRFDLKASGLADVSSYSVWIEDAIGSGQFASFGNLIVPHAGTSGANQSRGTLKWDTAHGDPLPFGVGNVADLSGHQIQIRDSTGTTLLDGAIP